MTSCLEFTWSHSRRGSQLEARPPHTRPAGTGNFMAWFFLASILALLPAAIAAPAQQAPPPVPGARPCGPASTDLKKQKKAPHKKGKSSEPPGVPLADRCIELHAPALDAQEFLQKYVRDRRWTIGDEDINEDTWTFSLFLDVDELLRYTKASSDSSAMNWRRGKALVVFRTSGLPGGYTRAEVSIRFEGYGDPQDQFAIKRESWPLASNGTLESSLISQLRAEYSGAH
jgi:hypothetical protein